MIIARWCTAVLLVILSWLTTERPLHGNDGADSAPTGTERDTTQPLHPVALGLVDEETTLLVANRNGCISILDLVSKEMVSEVQVGERLSDLKVLPGARHVFLTDELRHELVLLAYDPDEDPRLEVLQRLPVREHPVSVELVNDGRQCTVASLWSRCVTVVELTEQDGAAGPQLRKLREVPLPFAPRTQLSLANESDEGEGTLLVGDSFGGRLAVVDAASGTVDSVREIPGHNIRSLVLSKDGQHVHVSQCISDPLARTHSADIRWGITVASSVQTLQVGSLTDPTADVLEGSWVAQLGDFGNGVADPAGAALLDGERLIVAAGGVDAVVFADPRSGTGQLVPVGDRPTAVIATRDGKFVYVANSFADSVSIIDAKRKELVSEIALGPPSELTAAERGERLFYDAGLSLDNWFSCHSCHTDGHANGQLADTLGDGGYGDAKQVLSLLGVADTGPWAWNGTLATLAEQIDKSVRTSMHGKPLSADQAADLAAYLRTLSPPPSPPLDAAGEEFSAAVNEGKRLFEEFHCGRCHTPPTFTTEGTFDVGLVDESGRRRFNPPSLRGVGQRDRLLHDGRAASLEEVLSHVRHGLPHEISEEECEALMRYLRSL